jgi:MFS family permease
VDSDTGTDTGRGTGRPRWRDVYLSAGGRGVSLCGDYLAATSLTVVLQQRGAGGYAVAALLLSAALPPVLLARVAGRVADRFDSRWVIVTVALAQTLCCLAMLATSAPAALIALNALLACGVATTQPVFAALVPAMVGVAQVPRAAAISQTFTSAGMLAGPVLAGVLVGIGGLRLPLLLDAVSFLAIAAAGIAIRTRRAAGRGRATVTGRRAGRTYRLRHDRLLVVMLGMVAVVVAAANLMDVAIVFFVRGTLHGSAAMYGVVMASWMLGLVAGGWAAARRHTDDHGYLVALTLGLVLVCLAILGSGVAQAATWVVPAFLVGGVGNGMLGSAAGTLIARRTPENVRGMAFATLGAVINGAMVVGFVLGGALLAAVSPRAVMIGSGVSSLVLVGVSAVPALLVGRRAPTAGGLARERAGLPPMSIG